MRNAVVVVAQVKKFNHFIRVVRRSVARIILSSLPPATAHTWAAPSRSMQARKHWWSTECPAPNRAVPVLFYLSRIGESMQE